MPAGWPDESACRPASGSDSDVASPMSRQAALISAISSSERRCAASAVASGSMMWRNSCTVRRKASRSGAMAYQPSTSRSSRFQRSRGSTQLPIFGRELKQALGHQHLDGFAHGRTADVEGLRPFCLVGKDGSGRIVAAHDPQADLVGHRGMHARSRRCATRLRPCRGPGLRPHRPASRAVFLCRPASIR